jgi:HlyD family secretion protein
VNRRRWLLSTLAVALVALAGAAAWRLKHVEASGSLPTAPVRRGEFSVLIRCRGELRAHHSTQIVAPVNVPELRIVWLAPVSSNVKAGDVVVRFDPSSARQQLAEKEAAIKQAQAALDQATAEARITAEQDKRSLADASYQLERARLEVSLKEIKSVLEAEESKVDLRLAEHTLLTQKANAGLNEASSRAKLASLARQRDKAQYDVDLNKMRLSKMVLAAPSDGIIVYLPNYSQGWMNAKPFKVGDQVWPGGALAEIPDLHTIEMEGKIEEIDRAQVAVGQDARVRVDALPEAPFSARLTMLSPMTVMGFEWPPTRTFRGYASIATPDPRLRPGMNGAMDVIVNRIPNALSLPAKAVFTRRGKPVVYLARGRGYQMREVAVLARNPDEVAVSGISDRDKVALAEPPTP